MAVAANNGFELASVDIRAAFLLAKTFDREVFVKPLEDQRKEGWLWKLKIPLYSLDDASCMFLLKGKGTLFSLGLKIMPRDAAFHYLYEDGCLQGAVLIHVDDFTLTGKANILEKMMKGISETLTV